MPSALSMEELVRPTDVQGLAHWVEMVYDTDSDAAVPSGVFCWVRYLKDGESLAVRRIYLGDGSIMNTAREVYDEEVLEAIDAGYELGDPEWPEMLDVAATWSTVTALCLNPAKTTEDLVKQLAGEKWGKRILRAAYGA